jgi:hypothetical protein
MVYLRIKIERKTVKTLTTNDESKYVKQKL